MTFHDLFDSVEMVFAVFFAAAILWQLWTGKAVGRDWRVKTDRRDQPGKYWIMIFLQCAVFAVIFVIAAGMGK